MLRRISFKQAIAAAAGSYYCRTFLWPISQSQQQWRSLLSSVNCYIRPLFFFLFSFYFTFSLTASLVVNIATSQYSPIASDPAMAPAFRIGTIGELCESNSPLTEKTIIFIETSGGNCLRPRQACAIESAARTNPDMKIRVHMATRPPPGYPELDGGYGLDGNCQSMDVLNRLDNVQIIREDLTRHFLGTPLEALLRGGKFEKSKFSFQHLSDVVRIAMLHKSGGIYLDLDVVVLRSLGCLRNTAGEVRSPEYKAGIENGVLIFDKGHELLNQYMRLMEREYDPLGRESIGPLAFLKAASEFCGFGGCEGCDFGHRFDCGDNWNLTVLYTEAFYPIPFRNRERFYEPNFPLVELDNFQTSYVVHVYGAGHGAQVAPSSLYGFLAQRFCPAVYLASYSTSRNKFEF
ncbi:lactosylceramide 4-alpha-galactosyltransferase-like isoform X1 [Daphnia pulex]|uniref:lactosylceramide 4-alpha-galactosyltransferase-like isoform X1 n=1 Tax=Daphnia pulex TaxID=6669 RepID=UPI001EDFF42F|nr:lactosylceramide 4-alpha-galactosyltransferase-like isoform X1 [Daphnia pulex]